MAEFNSDENTIAHIARVSSMAKKIVELLQTEEALPGEAIAALAIANNAISTVLLEFAKELNGQDS